MKRKWKEIGGEVKTLEQGEEIVGELVNVSESAYSNIYTLKMEDGKEVKIFGSAMLDRKMEEVLTGTLVKIRYEGGIKTRRGRTAKFYRVWIAEDEEESEEDLPDFN